MPCCCYIKHPTTPEEREEVVKALHYAREIGDSLGVTIALAGLTTVCRTREEPRLTGTTKEDKK